MAEERVKVTRLESIVTDTSVPETGICSLCGGVYTHYGNNPEPLARYEERCCDDCNATKVIPARILAMIKASDGE